MYFGTMLDLGGGSFLSMYDITSLPFKNYFLRYPATSLPKNSKLIEFYFWKIFFFSFDSLGFGGKLVFCGFFSSSYFELLLGKTMGWGP